jgi:hypothetical protein
VSDKAAVGGKANEGAQAKVREERFPWGLGAILVLVIVGGIGFWLGSSSVTPVIVPVAAPVAPAPAPVTPVYPTYVPQGGGFPLIPLFFGLFFLFVIFKVMRRAAWASHAGGPGSFAGPRTWNNRNRGHGRAWYGPEQNNDEMFQRWHSRMHSESAIQSDGEAATDESHGAGSLDLPPDAQEDRAV